MKPDNTNLIQRPLQSQLLWPPADPLCESTFALIKSHAVSAGCIGPIMAAILEARLTILAATVTKLSGAQILALYEEHAKKRFWPELVNSVSGLVVPMIITGPRAISEWRQLLGDTDPGYADPRTIRARFGNVNKVSENAAHGSDGPVAAKREIGLFFPLVLTRI
jgi:nucleoside-diphosphate kinase